MRRLTFTLTLFCSLAVTAVAITGAVQAHDNCVDRNASGWQLTGCIGPDGTMTWTAIGPEDSLYRWVKGEWQLQQPPALPDVKPRIIVPTSGAFPFTGAGTHSFSPHVVYEATRSAEYNSTESLVQIATDSEPAGTAWLQISCESDRLSLVLHHEHRFPYIDSLQQPRDIWGLRLNEHITPALSVDGSPVVAPTVDHSTDDYRSQRDRDRFTPQHDRSTLTARQPEWMYQQIRYGQYLEMRIRGFSDPVVFQFNLRTLFDTPIQANIDRCGES